MPLYPYTHKQTRRRVSAARITLVRAVGLGGPAHLLLENGSVYQLPMRFPMGIAEKGPEAGDYLVNIGSAMIGQDVIPRAQFEEEFEPADHTPPFPGAALAPAALPTRVTKEALEAMFAGVAYEIRPDGRTTVCEITFKNGFTLRDESSCAVASEFIAQLGRENAYEKALDKAWAFAGFLLMEDRYRAGKA